MSFNDEFAIKHHPDLKQQGSINDNDDDDGDDDREALMNAILP
jgi:hypothetical protein